MTLEISEIGVHIAVGHAPAPHSPPTPAPPGEQPEPITQQQVEAIVQSCVQEVLRNLRLREER